MMDSINATITCSPFQIITYNRTSSQQPWSAIAVIMVTIVIMIIIAATVTITTIIWIIIK